MTRSTTSSPLAGRRTVLGAALLAALGVALLSGCSAGQITGTDTQVAAVPGVSAESADGKIALREAVLPYAGKYAAGATVPVEMRLFNNSKQSVRLTGATSARGPLVLVGSPSPTASPTGAASPTASATASATGSTSPTRRANGSATATATGASPSATSASPSPTETPVGSTKIDVTIPASGYVLLTVDAKSYLAVPKLQGEELHAGQSVEDVTLTFTYADGSTTTIAGLEVPMTTPLTPLPRPSAATGGGH